jgi:hypothetical protein
VREITFDEKGLRAGTSSELQAFSETIEGYTHQAGTRNVLRVRRFQPGDAQRDPNAAIFVLDLIVESATMAE